MNKSHCVNEQITEAAVVLILEDGQAFGLVPTYRALQMAYDKDLDLVLVSPAKNKKDAVCKIMDLGKLKYKESKQKKQVKHVTKEIKWGLSISDHDLETKDKKVFKFLEKQYKVRYTLELKGRFKYMKERALVKFIEHITIFEDVATWSNIKENNNSISITLNYLGK